MTDPEKPAFHVVDRRQSAQPTSTSPDTSPIVSDSAGDVLADVPPTNTDVNPAPAQNSESAFASSEVPSSNADGASHSADTDVSRDADNDMPAPDPGALLAYVAMQMDVKTLSGALLGVFSGHAWRALGLIADPVTGQTEKNLPAAQIAIDCVQFFLGKLDTDLNAEERREMQRRLNDLRVNYLAKMRES